MRIKHQFKIRDASLWKIRFKTEVCICSQFLTEAMQWIKEVEMVDSMDDLKIFVINKRYFKCQL